MVFLGGYMRGNFWRKVIPLLVLSLWLPWSVTPVGVPELGAQLPAPSIQRLKDYYKQRGHETDHLFADKRFVIHDNIDGYFKRAAESSGIAQQRAARKRGDTREAERLFRQEYENYKKLLNFDAKSDSIAQFMRIHGERLAWCEEKYGIPQEIIAAVIGIESNFGRNTGAFLAFNAYVSMYLKNYRREFAVTQLRELLDFSKKTGVDVFEFKSSYAGAIGYMQFLPYSLNNWFVGKDVYDMNDAAASIGNYLSHFRKQRGGSLERALYAYNNSRYYVTIVQDLAEHGKSARSPLPSGRK